MTNTQAAERQADHENLIRELIHFAQSVVRYAGSAGDDYLANFAREALAKAKEQGYA